MEIPIRALQAVDRGDLLGRLEGDEAVLITFLKTFLDDQPVEIEALRGALERADKTEAVRLAHSIKGAAASVGAERMSDLSQQIQNPAEDGHLNRAFGLVTVLDHSLHEFQIAVQACTAELTLPAD